MRKPWLLLLLYAASCAPATSGLKPVGASEAQNACPGGRLTWNLAITDLRAERKDTDRVLALIRDSLSKSFPACQWSRESSGIPTISIEVQELSAEFDGDMYDGKAVWTVRALSASGRTLTEFEAESHVPRPNYRGSNNEREALKAAFEQSLSRTATGLRNLPEVP